MKPGFFGHIFLTVLSIAYPALWYYGREAGWFVWLAAAMCGLWLLRALTAKLPQQRYAALFITLFFAAVLVFGRRDSMYWYPVLVNLMMLAVFGGSLFAGQTVIEKLARLQQPDLPEKAVRYTRRVTQVWCVFFIINGTLAALLARLGRYDWWAVYTGVIAYVLMGMLFAGEWLYRKLVLKV
ncbi:TPA: hypothetical protein ACFP4U_000480 [Neisseria lactamica]|uniref:COG4648 family protein n=2 Tax=Neisseria TaxID=482 RepID=UPI001864213B|nr:hypothetical protein [Neisseria lactamica]